MELSQAAQGHVKSRKISATAVAQPSATAIILDFYVPCAARPSTFRLIEEVIGRNCFLRLHRTVVRRTARPWKGCCRKLARIMGQIKGACGQSLSASCTMRKITRLEYVGTCVWLCKYALRRALTKSIAFAFGDVNYSYITSANPRKLRRAFGRDD